MAIGWDESNPADDSLISAFPTNERAFRAAVKAGFGVEHDDAEGRHKFGVGNDATRDAITDWVDGSLWLSTQVAARGTVLQRYNGSSWENLDVNPGDIPRLDEQSEFDTCQFAAWEEVTPASGSPDAIAVDLSTSPFKWATLVGNSILSNPSGSPPADHGTIVTFDIVQGGTAFTLTYGSNYRNPIGSVPIGGANTRTRLTIQLMANGLYLVQSLSDWNVSIT